MKALIAAIWLLHWLPLPLLGRMGEALGSLLFIIMKPRRRITLINLRLCFPELDEAARVSIARQHFQAYARSALERGILWWASEKRLKRLIRIDGELPLDVLRSGPSILLCPHFVCLEIPGIALVLNSELSICTIYARQQNKVVDDALLQGRSRFRPVKLLTREQGVKPIIRAMREGLPFIMLPDMDFGIRDAEFVPFFGIPAATLTAPARIAAATNAHVVPTIARYLPGYRGWRVTFYPPWENFPGPDMVEATRRMNAFIEAQVRETPAEYFWAHKRFKTRPPGCLMYMGKRTLNYNRRMKIKFTKMHGAGNDFVVIDAISQHIDFTPAQWKRIADRRFGVGADQLLVVGTARLPDADFSYRIYNADGGEVEQCGNGARAFARFVSEKGLSGKRAIRVETLAGVIEPMLEADGNVTVDMGAPIVQPALVPFDSAGLAGKTSGGDTLWPLEINGKTALFSVVSMGNPHAVQIVADTTTAPVAADGPAIEHHPRFPKRVNAGFMQILDRHSIRLRVFERGAGETLACGTGACAAAVAGIRQGLLDSPVAVQTHGGVLTIAWAGSRQPVKMTGPAVTVFEGEIEV